MARKSHLCVSLWVTLFDRIVLHIITIITSLAVPMGNMKQILWSTWVDKMGPSCLLLIACFGPVLDRIFLGENLQKGS